MEDVFQFIWKVREDGYEWRDGPFLPFTIDATEQADGPALIGLGQSQRHYQPEPNLFLKFAAIDPGSDSQILSFANTYGLLESARFYFPKRKKGEPVQSFLGELRSRWVENLHPMKQAVSLWDAITSKDTSLLEKCVVWESSQHITYHWPPSSDWQTPWSTHATIASPQVNQDFLTRFRLGDVVMPARMYLQKIVNEHLQQTVAPRLLWTPPDRQKMGLFFVPESLIGCLWYQLAGAIADFHKFRTCDVCQKPMLVAPEGSGYRTNRKTCSNACRIRLYAGRKAEARRLRSEKHSVREIAKQLDTDVEQIKKWIAER